jgi:hypothetical protein
VLSRGQCDRWSTYCGRRVPTGRIVAKVIGSPVPKKLDKTGYLLVSGDKPGLLIREVRHDGDFYQIKSSGLYGSVKALNSLNRKGFKAELVSAQDLIARAKKANLAYELTNVATKKRKVYWLLNSMGDQYVVGIRAKDGHLYVYNIEHPSAHKQDKKLVFNAPKAVKGHFDKMFAGVK